MKRLTKRDANGAAHRYGCRNVCAYCRNCDCDDMAEMVERLAAYEDTGLTPEEIAALRAELDAAKRDIKNMLQSESCEEFCAFCKRSMDDDCSISNCNAEWRGPCAENGGTE